VSEDDGRANVGAGGGCLYVQVAALASHFTKQPGLHQVMHVAGRIMFMKDACMTHMMKAAIDSKILTCPVHEVRFSHAHVPPNARVKFL